MNIHSTLNTQNSLFYPFEKIGEDAAAQMGGKGFNLAQLKNANFKVPDGGVLIADAFEQCLQKEPELRHKVLLLRKANDANENLLTLAQEIKTAIMAWSLPSAMLMPLTTWMGYLLDKGYPSVAVRSSSVLEDMDDSSFAGQYESVLGVSDQTSLIAAILTCWASAFDDKVIQYCLARNIPLNQLMPAVVIQGLIDSEVSGVLFTIDPMTGNDCNMVINAAEGLGEALVQGEVTPQHYHYNWYTDHLDTGQIGNLKTSSNDTPLLSSQQLRSFCAVALEIQAFYGKPQDIEWAYLNGEFHILQARPIAAIHFSTTEEWSNADFKDGGVASSIPTPLMWSLYEKTFESTMPAFLRKVGLHPKQSTQRWTNRFMGFPYWNLSAVKAGAKKIPGFVERQFEADLGIESRYQGNGHVTGFNIRSIFNGLKILFCINRSIKARLRSAPITLNKLRSLITHLEQEDLSILTDEQLVTWAQNLIEEHHQEVESEYFNTIYDNSNGATLFKDALKKYNNKIENPANELHLISGLDDVSHLRHVNQLWQLSRDFLSSPESLEQLHHETVESLSEKYQHQQTYPFSDVFNSYIEQHKHHSQRELDLLVECWDENPKQAFQSLLQMLDQGEESNPKILQQKQKQAYIEELAAIRSVDLKQKLLVHRELLVLREEIRDLSTKMYRIIRNTFLELGERLHNQGIIENREQLFFLDYSAALQYFRDPLNEVLAEQLKKNQLHYQCFRNYNKPNEIFSNNEPIEKRQDAFAENSIGNNNHHVLTGIASSPGIVEGEIWVHDTAQAISDIPAGIILVAPYTDPSYTLLFSSLSGLITETGGILSHGAVVSREYGIPAVLAVKNACTTLKTGMRVRVDGHNGEVYILNEH